MIATVYLLLAALTLGARLPHVPLAPHAATLRIAVVGDTGEGSDRRRRANARAALRAQCSASSIAEAWLRTAFTGLATAFTGLRTAFTGLETVFTGLQTAFTPGKSISSFARRGRIIAIQGANLDLDYVERWVAALGIEGEWNTAQRMAHKR